MRAQLFLTGLLTIGSTNAQLINGSFENGAYGWTVPCECATPSFSSDVAPGTGNQCIGLENVHLDCGCMLQSVVSQPTPWVTPGTWQLIGWIKSAVPGDVPGSRITLSDGALFSTPAVVNVWSFAGQWEYVEATFGVEDFINTDSLRVSLVPDDGNQQPLTRCYFDNIQLSAPQGIVTDAGTLENLHFRPNPATDKLWVDLKDVPLSITSTDACGRMHALKYFTHRDHTLEVDVSALPSGVNVLRITTSSGTWLLQFIRI